MQDLFYAHTFEHYQKITIALWARTKSVTSKPLSLYLESILSAKLEMGANAIIGAIALKLTITVDNKFFKGRRE